jgi:beta-glucosidase
VKLEAGESREVSFELSKRAFTVWDAVNKAWRVHSGQYTLQIGASSADIRLTGELAVNSASEPAEVSVPEIYLSGDPAKATAADFAKLLGRSLPPTHKPAGEPITLADTFELAGNTKWGRRIVRIVRRFTSKQLMGEMLYAEITQRPLGDVIYISGGLFTHKMAQGLVQILNGKHVFGGFLKILRGLPHLLFNIKKLLKLAF